MKYSIAFFLFIILFYLICNFLYKKTCHYKNSIVFEEIYHKQDFEAIKYANFGSTFSLYAFHADNQEKKNIVNFSFPCQSLEMDSIFHTLNLQKFEQDAVAFFVVTAESLLFENSQCIYPEQYYGVLKKDEIPDYQLKKKICHEFPLRNPVNLKYIIKDDEPYDGIYDKRADKISIKEAEKKMKDLVDSWKVMFGLKDFQAIYLTENNINVIKKNMGILNNMINDCKNEGVRPVVIIPPFSKLLNSFIHKEFCDEIIGKFVNCYCEKEEVLLLNYQYNSSFADPELYCDGGFLLNQKGSSNFINNVFSKL